MGSGTTGVSSKKYNRNFIGIELNPNIILILPNKELNQLYYENKTNQTSVSS
jgi:DNA modification methylase